MKGFIWCAYCGDPHSLTSTSCPKTGEPLAVAAPSPAPRGMPQGTVVAGRYEVRSLIAAEPPIMIYEAIQKGVGRSVVLKAIEPTRASDDELEAAMRSVRRELRVATRVGHPNVEPLLDSGKTEAGMPFVVRDQLRGSTLALALRKAGALPVEEVADLIQQVLSGVFALHLAGLVHRNVGAHSVVLLDRPDLLPVARVVGYGFSRPTGERRVDEDEGAPPGVHYSAPELMTASKEDPRADVFSCGALLYEMLAGRRPFEGASVEAVQTAIRRGERPALSDLCKDLDGAWIEIVDKALEPDPSKRFRDALAMQGALPVKRRPSPRLRLLYEEVDGLEATQHQTGAQPATQGTAETRGSRVDGYVGRKLANKYEILSLLGSGSAGAVYLAKHTALQRSVAIKVLHHANRDNVQYAARFREEALAAARLDHVNVARVLDSGDERDGSLYLVMEYIDGKSLEAVLAAEGKLTQARTVDIAAQVCRGLATAHKAGVIHRDIKPENIMVVARSEDDDAGELVKICDFGLARLTTDRPVGVNISAGGIVLGSPAYMSPEQVRGESATASCDIYALATSMFECLTGTFPHEATNVLDMFRKKTSEPPRAPSALVADIDPLLEDIIMRALAQDPKDRHPSADVLLGELREVGRALRDPSVVPQISIHANEPEPEPEPEPEGLQKSKFSKTLPM